MEDSSSLIARPTLTTAHQRGVIESMKESSVYVGYDIKGIQQFIFSVPKLKCIIGASGLIVNFDQAAEGMAKSDAGYDYIFAAGGRGAIGCSDKRLADALEDRLVQRAWLAGLDIRIGIDNDLSQAMHRADRLYPFVPTLPSGDETERAEPCAMSGLWPVKPKAGKGPNQDVHERIWERVQMARIDPLETFILNGLQKYDIPEVVQGYKLTFFKNVSPDPDDSPEESVEAHIAQAALGRRNRWAVVAMDGNDMGRQFLAFDQLPQDVSNTPKPAWLKQMSQALERCTESAFFQALGQAIGRWASQVVSSGEDLHRYCVPNSNRLILPFRPLILGGDDVTLLCHASYAMSFVRDMAQNFRRLSQEAQVVPRWPATGGELSMSAGILYTKVTFPLHMAIPYAESLLASAKGKFRSQPGANETIPTTPTPAAVDWDTITDTLVDTPAARRSRELCFDDGELGVGVQLTRRPYVLEPAGEHPDLDALFKLKAKLEAADISTSVLARILPSLQRPWSDRIAFIASLAKRHPLLKEQLWEGDTTLGDAWRVEPDGKTRVTGLPDALLLLEEEHRMAQATAAP